MAYFTERVVVLDERVQHLSGGLICLLHFFYRHLHCTSIQPKVLKGGVIDMIGFCL